MAEFQRPEGRPVYGDTALANMLEIRESRLRRGTRDGASMISSSLSDAVSIRRQSPLGSVAFQRAAAGGATHWRQRASSPRPAGCPAISTRVAAVPGVAASGSLRRVAPLQDPGSAGADIRRFNFDAVAGTMERGDSQLAVPHHREHTCSRVPWVEAGIRCPARLDLPHGDPEWIDVGHFRGPLTSVEGAMELTRRKGASRVTC
jgi:hypothetical protein